MYYKSGSERSYQIFIHLFVGLFALTALFPLIYVIGMSFTSQLELIKRNYFVIIPWKPTISAYSRILSSTVIWKSLLISILRAVVGTLLMLILTLVGAFVLSHRTMPGRKIFLLFILATILFSGGLIPTYLVIKNLGLLDTIWALIVPLLVDSFGLLIIKVFIENLPNGLIESAELDGASYPQKLIWIVAPLTRPALIAIGMFSIVRHWNSWFDALIYLGGNKGLWPIQLLLRNMLMRSSFLNDWQIVVISDQMRVSIDSLRMAAVVIGIIPLLIVYPFFQKHFIKGVYLGAIKG